jgi:carboxymethylenebutenolidase
MPNIETKDEDVTIKCSDGADMHAFVSRPKKAGQYPGIIVIHEIWGLNDQIRGVARRYAQQGYVALAPHLFSRYGDALSEKNIQSAMKPLFAIPREKRFDPTALQGIMGSMSDSDKKVVQTLFAGRQSLEPKMVEDAVSCQKYLSSLNFVKRDKLGITGFCMGGGLAFQVSTMLPFSASVIFYGANPKPIESVSKISGPILAFYAGEDEMLGVGIPAITEAMFKNKKTFAMKLYKGVQHAFFNETSSVYNKEAADDAWQMAIAFFNKYLM